MRALCVLWHEKKNDIRETRELKARFFSSWKISSFFYESVLEFISLYFKGTTTGKRVVHIIAFFDD